MIPDYTERDFELNVPPPFAMRDVTAWVATQGIDWAAAQCWVDETLNWRPAGADDDDDTRFLAGPVAFITFMKIGTMSSLDPAYGGWPSMRESEMHVILPVFERGFAGIPNFVNPRFYPLVLVLDSSPAMIAGREVYGFPKIFGSVRTGDDLLESKTEVFRQAGDPTSSLDQRFIAIYPDSYVPGGGERVASVPGCLREMTRDALNRRKAVKDEDEPNFLERWAAEAVQESLEWFMNVMASLMGPQEFVFLKQFRDHASPRKAAYRAVTESPVTFSNLQDPVLLPGDWHLDVPEHRSSRLLKEIGLESGPIGRPLRVGFDFDLPLARTIWSG